MSHRSAVRNRVLKSATIEFGGGALTCVVRNWSNTGAMLDVSPIGIPEHFTLLDQEMAAEGRVALYGSCSVPIQDMNLGTVCADTIQLGDLRAQ
jgi:hypothetical protein